MFKLLATTASAVFLFSSSAFSGNDESNLYICKGTIPFSYDDERKVPLTIKIYVENDEYLVVSNNLQKKNSSEVTTRLGLRTIIKRYRFITEREVIVTKTQEEFIVKIPLIDEIIEP